MIKTQESTRAFLGRLCRRLWETLACLMLLPGCGDSSTAQFERGSQGEGMLGQQSREEAKLGKSVSGGSLDDLAALMERKEEEFANRPVAFAEDFAKYRKVLSSRFADDRLKGLAWGELRKKWSTDESVSPAAALIWHEDRVMVVTAWTVPVIGMKLVPIPAGRFVIGSPSSEADRSYRERQHEVVISRPFWMGRYEVTQGEWESVMGSNPSHFRGSSLPVEQVS